MFRRKKLSFAQKKCVSTAGMAMQRSNMVRPGDRIGIAASGGVDSFVLTQVMLYRQAIMPFDVELMVLHTNPGFDRTNHRPLVEWCRKNGISGHFEVTDHGPRAHSEENKKKSPCFYCAMLRRKRLFELCGHYGLTHLAFGHNAEDLAATFAMNLLQGGRVDGLGLKESFFSGRLTVIRPLLFLEKKYIKSSAAKWNLPVWSNPCPSAGNTNRDTAFDWLASSWEKNAKIRGNVLNALTRFELNKHEK